jgi:hypothetical protein
MSIKKYSGHRVSLVIPIETYEKIVARAAVENRPIANLCTALIVNAFTEKE